MTDLCYTSLTANNIIPKLTNQFSRTGLITLDQHTTFLLTVMMISAQVLEKSVTTTDQSFFRTTLTWMIRLHNQLL